MVWFKIWKRKVHIDIVHNQTFRQGNAGRNKFVFIRDVIWCENGIVFRNGTVSNGRENEDEDFYRFQTSLYLRCMLFLGNSLTSEFYMLTFRNTLSHLHRRIGMTPIRLWRWNRQSVPKRRHINFRRRRITQKKAYIVIIPCATNEEIKSETPFCWFEHRGQFSSLTSYTAIIF